MEGNQFESSFMRLFYSTAEPQTIQVFLKYLDNEGEVVLMFPEKGHKILKFKLLRWVKF